MAILIGRAESLRYQGQGERREMHAPVSFDERMDSENGVSRLLSSN